MEDKSSSLIDALAGLTPEQAMEVLDASLPAIREVRERLTGEGAKAQKALMAAYQTQMDALIARGAGTQEKIILRQAYRQKGLKL